MVRSNAFCSVFFFLSLLSVHSKKRNTLVSFFPVTAGNASAALSNFLHCAYSFFMMFSFFLRDIYCPLSGTFLRFLFPVRRHFALSQLLLLFCFQKTVHIRKALLHMQKILIPSAKYP